MSEFPEDIEQGLGLSILMAEQNAEFTGSHKEIPPPLALTSMKRVVLEFTQGDSAGRRMIVGCTDEALPEFLLGVGSAEFASLVKVTPRFALYREAVPPKTMRFGEAPPFDRRQV